MSFWVIFCPFSPLTNQKIKILKLKKKHGVRQTEFFVILQRFLSFYPPIDLENQNFEKLKQPPGDIIILHKRIKNNDHTLYCFLDRAHNRFNCYFLSWAIFYPFTPLTAQKIKIRKSEKKPWRYHHFTIVYQNSWSYATLFLRYGAWRM